MTSKHRLSNEQLRALRAEGIVPWSRVATKCCIISLVLAFVMLNFERLLNGFRNVGSSSEKPYLAETLFFFIFGSSVVFLATGFIVSILQTRAAPSLNLMSAAAKYRSKPSMFLEMLGFVIGVGVGVSLLYWMIKVIPMQLILESKVRLHQSSFAQIYGIMEEVVRKTLTPLIMGLLMVGFVVAFVSRMRFLQLYNSKKKK